MALTPLINLIKEQGGTYYAFTSGINDERRASHNDTLKFVFSKFVCLKIPEIKRPVYTENYIQFNTIDGAIFNGLDADVNVNLSESFQNYALNLESILLDTYSNSTTNKTVSERVFFKWLKELGAIRFQAATDTESTEIRYVEEETKTTGAVRYERVVKYIGDIDIVNPINQNGITYTELYLYIPTEAGNTPVILFDSITDINYNSDMALVGSSEYIEGRTSSTIHPNGLDINAFFDYDIDMIYTDSVNANWHNQSGGGINNAYFTEPTEFIDYTNIDIYKAASDYTSYGAIDFTDTYYRRSKLDGISIDFDITSYKHIVDDPNIENMQQYNSSDYSNDFDFNAVLIYYDIYNKNDVDTKATNLYGILFLDNITPTSDGGYIQTYKKYKHNIVKNINGNSYGFTINTKTSSTIINSDANSIINDYNTYSMSLFVDAFNQLQIAANKFTEQELDIQNITDRLTELENLGYSINNIIDLQSQIDAIINELENAQLALNDNNVILDLISKNSDRINDIINGKLPIDLQYNTDVLQAGEGISLDKSVLNKVIINNSYQTYSIISLYDENGSIIDENNPYNLLLDSIKLFLTLTKNTNYIKVYTSDDDITSTFKIYIDDSSYTFKKGQSIKIIFKNTINLNNYNIEIYTDSLNRFSNGIYNKIIGRISSTDLVTDMPYIEIVCIDNTNYIFDINIIR